jgi:hypothetical protein
MKNVFKVYFGHPPIILYYCLGLLTLTGAIWLNPLNFVAQIWILLIPVLLAPFFEWVAHKYLLHRITDPQLHPRGYQYMLKLHYKHHWTPADLHSVFAPVSSAFVVFLILALPAYLVLGLQGFLIFETGVIAYFLYYEWIHLAHHVGTYRPLTRFGRHMRNAHTWHHFKNENYWWGVTNPLGDYLLGTFKEPQEVEKSPSAKSLGDLNRAASPQKPHSP